VKCLKVENEVTMFMKDLTNFLELGPMCRVKLLV